MRFDRYEPLHRDGDDDDRTLPVSAPRRPAPKFDYSAVALPEPDDEGVDLR